MSDDTQRPAGKRGDYLVGYGRPPKETRFQPGQSGNKNGRPKGSKNLGALFAQELAQIAKITERGRLRKMSKQQVLVKSLVNEALKGNPKATALVVDQIRRNENQASNEPASTFDRDEDQMVMTRFVERSLLNDALGSKKQDK